MKRSLFAILIIFSMVFSLSGSIRPVLASSPTPIADLDQDGISNALENAGWYNLTGGPYKTNPNEADTDHDGLTDAQEKLFNTDPTNPQDPGISVQYQSSYKTFEYYNTKDPAYLKMTQGGNQYLLTEGAVIRRGTTFKINAVNSETATLTVSGAGLTGLTPIRDIARGGWNVTVPINGTVGTYNATITDGAWSKSMPIYVIFELPTDMTQAQISAYLYDDDPANKRDEVAVWWRAIDWKYYNADSVTSTPCLPTDPICSSDQYHTISGYAQAFWTEQFTKNVLLTYTLPVINGLTNQFQASSAIGDKADQSVRVNFASVRNSFSSATKVYYDPIGHPNAPYSENGGGCETSAGVYTAMLRSVGIASRPVVMDYNKTVGHGESGNYGIYEYDTAVMLWAKSPNDTGNSWYVERTFNGPETEYQTTPVWTSGPLTPLMPLSAIGSYSAPFKHFQDAFADNIQSANENWDFQNGSLGGGMVNTEWTTGFDIPAAEFAVQNRDFKWNSKYPLAIQQSPDIDILDCQLWKGDKWAPSEWYAPGDPLYSSNPPGRTARQTYNLPLGIPTVVGDIENWPYNPQPTSCSDSTSAAACTAFQQTWQPVCPALPGQAALSPQPAQVQQQASLAPSSSSASIQLGSILSDAAVDQNGAGRFDQLDVNFQLTSDQAGQYQLGGWLKAGDKQIRADLSQVTLAPGLQTLHISFDGQQIGDNHVNGPFQVEAIWVAPASQAVSDLALPAEMTAYQTYTYSSQAYNAAAFTVRGASISGNYSYSVGNRSANGQLNTISISVPLNIAIPGAYKVDGDLYDAQDQYVGHAEWTGSAPAASLGFTVSGTTPPYSLEHLNLADSTGKNLDSFYAPVYKIVDLGGKVNKGNVTLMSSAVVVAGLAVTPSNSFTLTPVDSNANGITDQLVVSTSVDVTGQGGSYWMEGLFVDDHNLPVAWSVGDAQTLAVGANQILQMTFDARMLYDQLPLTGSKPFTLVAVKIFSGSLGQAVLEADIPITGFSTPAYSRAQLESSVPAYTLFQDDMENGVTNWAVAGSSQWSQATAIWHSYTTAWTALGSASTDGILRLAAPLNLTDYASPWLRFNTAYQIGAGQSVNLEVSKDGTNWTILKTYTGNTAYWSSEIIDLSAYGKTAGIWIRFNAQSYPGLVWSVDDVYVNAGPAIKSASFTYPSPVKGLVNTTFTADYVSINKALPATYKWDFCGVPAESTTPAIVHQFTTFGNCLVKLTIDNGYDSADAAPQTVVVLVATITVTPTPVPSPTVAPSPTPVSTAVPPLNSPAHIYLPVVNNH